jgi:cation transporter-like permease
MGFGVVLAAVLTDDYYRNPAAVGISISTIVIPFSLLALASFAVSLRNANRDRVRLTPDFIVTPGR